MTLLEALIVLVRLDRDPEKSAWNSRAHLQALDLIEAEAERILKREVRK